MSTLLIITSVVLSGGYLINAYRFGKRGYVSYAFTSLAVCVLVDAVLLTAAYGGVTP